MPAIMLLSEKERARGPAGAQVRKRISPQQERLQQRKKEEKMLANRLETGRIQQLEITGPNRVAGQSGIYNDRKVRYCLENMKDQRRAKPGL